MFNQLGENLNVIQIVESFDRTMNEPSLVRDNTLPEFTDVILQVQPTPPNTQKAVSEVFESPTGKR